jgi:hypothetical protein
MNEAIALAGLSMVLPVLTLFVVYQAITRSSRMITLEVSNALGKLELSINGKVDKVMDALKETAEVKGKVEGLIEAQKTVQVVDRRKENDRGNGGH